MTVVVRSNVNGPDQTQAMWQHTKVPCLR